MALGKGFKTDTLNHDKMRLFKYPKDHDEPAKTKVALVTGAGTGIGKAAAKAFLKGGYQVALTGRSLDKLEKAIVDIGGDPSNCLAVSCDVGKPD